MEQPYFYANQGYNFNRLPRKTITIKLDTSVTSKVYSLHEPITIDQHSDIFIEFSQNEMGYVICNCILLGQEDKILSLLKIFQNKILEKDFNL